MAHGKAKGGGCGNDCSPRCDQNQLVFPGDPDDRANLENLTNAADLGAGLPAGREIIFTAVERDDNGHAIGVEIVHLGREKLVLTASATALLISCSASPPVVAGGDGALRPTTSARADTTGAGGPLSPTGYRDALLATCQEKGAKLERVFAANPDGTPIGELVNVLQDQLTQITALNPPDDLADEQARLVTAYQDRVSLLRRVSTQKDVGAEQRDALLAQADAFAVQVDDAYRALGVPECAS